MSDKKKIPWEMAMPVAEEIVARLAPACERIAVAGSLRRLKKQVSDIEIVYVPKMSSRPDGLFDRRIVSVAHEVIENWMTEGYLAKRPNVNGSFTWGEANKLAIHVPSQIPVDLFATNLEAWWVSLVVRTGSKETNLALTTGAQRRNAKLNAYGFGVRWSDGTVTKATSEEHVFEMCGVPYKRPSER